MSSVGQISPAKPRWRGPPPLPSRELRSLIITPTPQRSARWISGNTLVVIVVTALLHACGLLFMVSVSTNLFNVPRASEQQLVIVERNGAFLEDTTPPETVTADVTLATVLSQVAASDPLEDFDLAPLAIGELQNFDAPAVDVYLLDSINLLQPSGAGGEAFAAGSGKGDGGNSGKGGTQTGEGENDPSEQDAGGQSAEFFGLQAKGSKFVFVVDCSISMGDGGKWSEACRELADSIDKLDSSQSFYVVFFDGETHRMFGDKIYLKELLPATTENLMRFRAWADSIRLGYNTSPALGVKFACTLEPDAIFLLSDGEFADTTAPWLRKNNDGEIPVHTIGFRTPLNGQKMLSRIAEENNGQFRRVN